MEKLNYKITIDAPREKVWEVLWGDSSYTQWTIFFSPSSNVVNPETSMPETDWKKGSKILFTDGSGSGMVAKISDNIPNEYMSFTHLGEIKDGVEDLTSEKVKGWAGAKENYRLKDLGGKTELEVDVDTAAEYAEMFKGMWPKALDKVKELSEH